MKQTLGIAILLLLSTACNKPDDIPESQQSYLVKHSWKFWEVYVNGSKQNLPACYVDDIWAFSPSGNVNINYGDIKCSSSQQGSVSGTYQFPGNNTLLVTHSGSTYVYSINTIDEYYLDITAIEGIDSVRYVLNAR
jgi:hypothetical protein